jgi:hypothetical protein
MAIDTLAYVKSLEAAGVDRRAAEAHAEALAQHVVPDLTTQANDIKDAIDELRAEIHAGFARIENRFAEIDARFAKIDGDMNARFAGIEGRMTNLPTSIQLVFMQATLIVTLFVAAYGLLKLTGHG